MLWSTNHRTGKRWRHRKPAKQRLCDGEKMITLNENIFKMRIIIIDLYILLQEFHIHSSKFLINVLNWTWYLFIRCLFCFFTIILRIVFQQMYWFTGCSFISQFKKNIVKEALLKYFKSKTKHTHDFVCFVFCRFNRILQAIVQDWSRFLISSSQFVTLD